jgi:hypothetical protein
MYPSKDFKKISDKNVKHEKKDPPRFSHNPQYPPQKKWKDKKSKCDF